MAVHHGPGWFIARSRIRPRSRRGPHRPAADAVRLHRVPRRRLRARPAARAQPKDFDIATSATPRQVKRLFSNCRIIGRRFRLAHVYFQSGKIIEVATFRARDAEARPRGDDPADGAADDADDLLIRDDNVFGTPEEDALRRDFTINALFYDVNAETVIDHADGLGDLRRRLVRTIGDPEIRFREDPIRILRAIKFAARLDFAIEPTTLEALSGHAPRSPRPPRRGSSRRSTASAAAAPGGVRSS